MLYKIPIETSARHIHVSKEDFEKLFGPGRELTFKKELSQPGQFLSGESLMVKGPRGTFERVSILGPFRNETQVELSLTDTRYTGIEGVIRQSGHTKGTPGCELIGEYGSITLDHGVIVAKRHIHMTPEESLQMGVRDNDNVCVITKSFERAMIFADVVVRVHPDFRLAMHVDTDEANAFSGDDNPYGMIVKLFDNRSYDMTMWMDELEQGIYR